jgi:hypothetical protein
MAPETQTKECESAVGQINQNSRKAIYLDTWKKKENGYQ